MTAAGRDSASDTAGRPSRTGVITQWRNWSIPVKLAAVVLVPVVFAVTLGVVQIQEQVQRADRYKELDTLLQARDNIQPLLTGLQAERTASAKFLAGSGDLAAVRARAKTVTVAASKAPRILDEVAAFTPSAKAQFGQLRKQLVRLPGLREKVLTSSIEPVAAVRTYNEMVDTLLGLERAVLSNLSDQTLYGTVGALHEMSSAEDEVRIQRALVAVGLARDEFGSNLLDMLNDSRARLKADLAAFNASASPAQQSNYRDKAAGLLAERERMLDGLVQAASSSSDSAEVSLSPQQWNASSTAVIDATTQIRTDLSQQSQRYASGLYDEASDRAGLDAVLLLSALLLAAAVMFVIARHLLRSLTTLRRSALDAAAYQLPEAVDNIRQGGQGDTEVAAVPVRTTEEIGQLARAFDEVNRQALYLASEQAGLRRGYSDSFVNVSRRSQSLLERQLRLFEQLEQDEEDPDQLATLFRLDHLATRMRRNNENLMVLSGSDLARRFNQPTPVADVLRAAVSEIEHYPRVAVQPPPTVRLVGYAGSDLVRLLAELLDNAANFSAPTTSVTVSSYQAGDGSIVVDVLDQGIGMDSAELAETNARLASVEEPDLSTSRRMGVLVISRLATRHGITVRLHGGSDVEGTRASVLLPPELVVSAERGGQQSQQQPAPGHGPGRNGKAKHDLPTSRVDDGARRHVMEGGLPQHALGNDVDSGPASSPGAPPPMSGPNQPRASAAPPSPPRQPPAPPQQPPPPPPPAPATPPAPPTPPPSETPGPAGQGRTRGLFEPPSSEEKSDEPSPFAPEEMPRQRARNEWEPPSGSGAGGVDLPVPDTSAWQPRPASPMFDAGSSTQWFHPTDEDAYYQAEAGRPDIEDHPWPTKDDVVSHDPREKADRGSADHDGLGVRTDQAPRRAGSPGTPAKSEPSGYTASGLPRRTKGGQPVPGGTTDRSEARTGGRREPEDARDQLSSSQHGLQQSQSGTSPRSAPRQDNGSAQDSGESAWNFATDQAQHQADAAANHEPSDYTAAGLPRRTPRAQLAPGSAAPQQQRTSSGSHSQSSPEDARGRLSSFQQGVRRGRHSAPDED